MNQVYLKLPLAFFLFLTLIFVSCQEKNPAPSREIIDELKLKKGEVITCGASGSQFGSVEFGTSCSKKVKKEFSLAIELLHSFEYDESEKVFAKIIDTEPQCAMAYWGVAMCNYHPLWTPPAEAELKKGAKAVEIAKSIKGISKREEGYIDAIAAFYTDWKSLGHQTRCLLFENKMAKLYADYPGDPEAAIFYALALDASADPTDLTYSNQKKAGRILYKLYPDQQNHPGIAHYIIHTYDDPVLAPEALAVVRRYASIAPSSAHAQHMPSHIFTRLGLWDESIKSNIASIASARCYAETAGLEGHWDEELHGLDYLVYAYLQKGEDSLAKAQWKYLQTISRVDPVNFKVAYAFAAIPSRYLLENSFWKEAADIKLYPVNFPWQKFPWQEAIFHFTRLMGCVHTGKIQTANAELQVLKAKYDTLIIQKDLYKSNEVKIQILTAEAWILYQQGENSAALQQMRLAADMEDKREKNPVSPGEIIPARELLGDMELQMNKPESALSDYQKDLMKHANRFNGLYGAGLAAEKSGRNTVAFFYYRQLLLQSFSGQGGRPELARIKQLLK